jgi:adenine-specific DNA-methyltransferase
MDESVSKGSLALRERDRVRGSKTLLSRARALRGRASEAERVLWYSLRGRGLNGYKFQRQVVIEPYIVDFLCLEARLIVEADGGQHADQMAYDARRATRLQAMGYRVLRFWNHEILREREAVLERIAAALSEASSPRPSPGGRGR